MNHFQRVSRYNLQIYLLLNLYVYKIRTFNTAIPISAMIDGQKVLKECHNEIFTFTLYANVDKVSALLSLIQMFFHHRVL